MEITLWLFWYKNGNPVWLGCLRAGAVQVSRQSGANLPPVKRCVSLLLLRVREPRVTHIYLVTIVLPRECYIAQRAHRAIALKKRPVLHKYRIKLPHTLQQESAGLNQRGRVKGFNASLCALAVLCVPSALATLCASGTLSNCFSGT